MFAMSLQRSTSVVDKLLERFGAARLSRVEQLSPNSFRAHLSGGEIALAVFDDAGKIYIKETEMME